MNATPPMGTPACLPWARLEPLRLELGMAHVRTGDLAEADRALVPVALAAAEASMPGFAPGFVKHVQVDLHRIVRFYASPVVALRGQRFITQVGVECVRSGARPEPRAAPIDWWRRIEVPTVPGLHDHAIPDDRAKDPWFRPDAETNRLLKLVDLILRADTTSEEHARLRPGLARLARTHVVYILQSAPAPGKLVDAPFVFELTAHPWNNDHAELSATLDLEGQRVVESTFREEYPRR